jgi:hypothetical protein
MIPKGKGVVVVSSEGVHVVVKEICDGSGQTDGKCQ